MDLNTIVVIVVLVVLVGVVMFSSDPLSSAIRAKLPFLQRKAARAIDTVEARTTSAQEAQGNTVRKGRRSLYAVKQDLAASQIELDAVVEELRLDDIAIAKAHQNGDRVNFDALVAEKNSDLAVHAQLAAGHEQLVAELKSLEVAIDQEREKEREIQIQSRVLNSKARVADVTTGVYEAQAGLNENGAQAQMDAAQKILNEKLAKANAAKDSAAGMTPGERRDRATAEYLKQAKQSSADSVNGQNLWDQMSQKAAGESPSTTPSA